LNDTLNADAFGKLVQILEDVVACRKAPGGLRSMDAEKPSSVETVILLLFLGERTASPVTVCGNGAAF